jgi:hypothetical protein
MVPEKLLNVTINADKKIYTKKNIPTNIEWLDCDLIMISIFNYLVRKGVKIYLWRKLISHCFDVHS